MRDIGLRRAVPADIAFIMATERLPGFDRFIGQWTADGHRAAMADVSNAYLIGFAGTGIGAFAIMRDLDDDNGNVCLKRIAVTAPGGGFGSRFLAAVIDWAFVETPAHRLWLDVVPDNPRARHVYRARGFIEEGAMREAFPLPDGGRSDLLLMSITRPEWTARNSSSG